MEYEEHQWLEARRQDVELYLRRAGVQHGRIAADPSWHLTPYVSIWAIESGKHPGRVGWWVVAGDHPTDYVSWGDADTPRRALQLLGMRWSEVSEFMRRGEAHPTVSIGSPEDWPQLGELLSGRSAVFLEWAADPELW